MSKDKDLIVPFGGKQLESNQSALRLYFHDVPQQKPQSALKDVFSAPFGRNPLESWPIKK